MSCLVRLGAPFSTEQICLVRVRPRLRAIPLRLRGNHLSVATADLAADLHLACEPCILLASLGPTTANLAMISAFVFSALLQLLRRSAADIVREDTDREMATPLMDPLAPPDPCVQALFFELDAIGL